jgi:hypothetical protein
MTLRLVSIAAGSLVLLILLGCGALGPITLPSTVLIQLPDGTTAEAEQGSGVASLADSTWQFYRTTSTGQGTAFLTVRFGSAGNLEAFENNTIGAEVFGPTIYFDGQRHSTLQPGVSYVASTYGAETSDGTGFAFEARMTAFAAGLEAGYANATASGTFDPDDPDTMTGTFAYETRTTLISIPEADQEGEWSFIARRVAE